VTINTHKALPEEFKIAYSSCKLYPALEIARSRFSLNRMKVKHSVFINLPVEEIFAYLSNLENLPDWSGVVISVRKISPEEMVVGTAVRCTIRILGRWFDMTYETVECVPNRYLTFKSVSSIAPSLICYQFEPLEGIGTNLIVEENINFPGGFLGFAEPVVKGVIRRQLSYDLLTLKDILETTASICSDSG
jgi:uncharacterized membrane protein